MTRRPAIPQHYFDTFLIPSDLFPAMVKVVLMGARHRVHLLLRVPVHSGGPAGVAMVGRAVRSALISLMFIDLIFAIAVWVGPPSPHRG